jgi:hypothetical protein
MKWEVVVVVEDAERVLDVLKAAGTATVTVQRFEPWPQTSWEQRTMQFGNDLEDDGANDGFGFGQEEDVV